MTVLLSRLFLATALVATPALVAADTEDTPEGFVEAVEAESDVAAEAEPEATEAAEPEEAAADAEAAWANKLRKRHHEGDVALGVCGARMSALMWFYQSSVADGRDDLQPAYEAIKESRTILKNEAERRAIEDGVGTSVSVMNEHSEELWEGLVEASGDAETFQVAHDELFTNVQECLSLFFNRGVKPGADTPAAEEPADDDADEADAEQAD